MKKIIITILVIILVALLGLIGYQCFNNNEEKIDEENVEINNGVFKGENLTVEKINYLTDEDKIDSTKPFIYAIMPLYDETDIDWGKIKVRKYKNEFTEYEKNIEDIVSVPYINIKLDNVDEINFMLKAYCLTNYRSIFDDIAGNENIFCSTVNIYNDVLSIFVTGNIGYNNYNVGINYDLKTKKMLSLDELMNKLSITDEKLKTVIELNHNKMKEEPQYRETDVNEMFDRIKRNSNLNYKIFREKIDLNKSVDDYAKTFYYNENSGTYSLVGWDEYKDDEHAFAEDLINNQKVCYFINEDNKLALKYYYKQVETGMLFDSLIVVE